MKTRRLTSPWPFPLSVVGKHLVQNLPPKPKPLARLKRVKPSSNWKQEPLL